MSLEPRQKSKIVSIPFVCAAGTDVGRRREHNEDTFIFDAKHGFFMVVDGMGGHEKGEVAARLVAETVQTAVRRIENSPAVRLRDSITLANNALCEHARAAGAQMGCVLTALLVEETRAVIGHIGDTRAYKIHDGKMQRLTTDHSIVGILEEAGELSEKRLLEHPRRNEVTRGVGFEEKSFEDEQFIEIYETGFETDAAFLLCSDGLSDLLTTAQIFEIITANAGSPSSVIENLIEKANALGGRDNITAIFVGGSDFAQNAFRQNAAPSKIKRLFGWLTGRAALFFYGLLLGGIIFWLFSNI